MNTATTKKNTLVLYDSQFGNTEHIAQIIAQALGAYGPTRVERVDKARPSDIEDAHLLVLGCPTQGWRATPAMRAFLNRVPEDVLCGVAVACFDTRFDKSSWLTGSAAKRVAKLMKKRGVTMITPPESFFVEETEGPLEIGELSRAERWAKALYYKAKQSEVLQQALDGAIVEAVP